MRLLLRIIAVVQSKRRCFVILVLAAAGPACGRIDYLPLHVEGPSVQDAEALDADAALDAPVRCEDTPGVLFCDGFEDPIADRWTSTVESGGTVDVISAPVRTGNGALAATQLAIDGRAAVSARGEWPAVTAGEIFVRSHHFVPATSEIANVSLAYVGQGATPFAHIAVHALTDGRLALWAYPVGISVESEPGLLPRDSWFCLVVRITIGTAGSVSLVLDGVEQARIEPLDTAALGPYDALMTGITQSRDQVATIVYADDVTLSTAALSCAG